MTGPANDPDPWALPWLSAEIAALVDPAADSVAVQVHRRDVRDEVTLSAILADEEIAIACGGLVRGFAQALNSSSPGWQSAMLALTITSVETSEGTIIEPGVAGLVTQGNPEDGTVEVLAEQIDLADPDITRFLATHVDALLNLRDLHTLGGTDPDGETVPGGLDAWNVLVIRWGRSPRTVVIGGGSIARPYQWFGEPQGPMSWLAGPQRF